MEKEGREEIKRKFIEFLEKKDFRITNQRRVIIDTVFSTDEHFTAEQLLEWARKKDSSVSRATVYRTLPLLTESKLVQEMDSVSLINFTTRIILIAQITIILSVKTVKKLLNLTVKKLKQLKMKLGIN